MSGVLISNKGFNLKSVNQQNSLVFEKAKKRGKGLPLAL